MEKIIAENKKAHYDYEIQEKYEAGIVLFGHEVKSVKGGNISLKGAYVTFHDGNAYLTGAHIGRYKPAGRLPGYDPERSRALLLKKREINYLKGKSQIRGLTIMPLSVYTRGSKIKVEVGVGRGRKQYEKKEKIKKKDIEREVRRTLKSQ